MAYRDHRNDSLRLRLDFISSDNSVSRRAVYELIERGWLSEGKLNGVYLDGADLSNIDWLHNLRMEYAYSPKSNMNRFDESILINANLRGSSLGLTTFHGSNLQGADLAGVRGLDRSNFNNQTTMPDGENFNADTDIEKFTDVHHDNFWRSDDERSPASKSIEQIEQEGGIRTAMGAYL